MSDHSYRVKAAKSHIFKQLFVFLALCVVSIGMALSSKCRKYPTAVRIRTPAGGMQPTPTYPTLFRTNIERDFRPEKSVSNYALW